jgi:co-chaperonin GroES (HSP10)
MATRKQSQMAGENQDAEQQQQETNELLQDTTVGITETHRYSLKDAEPLAGNMIIKVSNFDQPSTRYYYTPYPVDANVLLYGEVVAVDPYNERHIKSGDHVLYNGSILYQSIENGHKYVVAPANNVLLIWRSKNVQNKQL